MEEKLRDWGSRYPSSVRVKNRGRYRRKWVSYWRKFGSRNTEEISGPETGLVTSEVKFEGPPVEAEVGVGTGDGSDGSTRAPMHR